MRSSPSRAAGTLHRAPYSPPSYGGGVNACIEVRFGPLGRSHVTMNRSRTALRCTASTPSCSGALHEVGCSETSRAAGEEEEEPAFSIALPVAGVFVHHGEGTSTVGAPG